MSATTPVITGETCCSVKEDLCFLHWKIWVNITHFSLVDYGSWIKSWEAYILIWYQPEELNLIWEHSFRWIWECFWSCNCFFWGLVVCFGLNFHILPSCNTSVFCWGKFQWNHATSQFDVHNVLYLILM